MDCSFHAKSILRVQLFVSVGLVLRGSRNVLQEQFQDQTQYQPRWIEMLLTKCLNNFVIISYAMSCSYSACWWHKWRAAKTDIVAVLDEKAKSSLVRELIGRWFLTSNNSPSTESALNPCRGLEVTLNPPFGELIDWPLISQCNNKQQSTNQQKFHLHK